MTTVETETVKIKCDVEIEKKEFREKLCGIFHDFPDRDRLDDREYEQAIEDSIDRVLDAMLELVNKVRPPKADLFLPMTDLKSVEYDDEGEIESIRTRICGDKIERSPKSFRDSGTLDHIRALSRGGQHTRSNVQAAHLRCNSSKSDATQLMSTARGGRARG